MADIKLSKIAGDGGLPTPASLNPYQAGGSATTGAIRPKNGREYGTVAASQPLTTILDVTEKSTYSYLFLTLDGNASFSTDQIKVTVNGAVIHDLTSTLFGNSGGVIMILGNAFYGALSTTQSVIDTSGGLVMNGSQMESDSLKIEIATGAGGTVSLRSDLEMIQ